MSPFTLRARWVLPVESPPIAGGVVTVVGERIAAVSTQAESGVPVHDLGDVVLMPGLVNAHTHLEFSQLDSPLGKPGMPLPTWIRTVIANRKQQSEAGTGLVSGLQESLLAGVTTIGEIATTQHPTASFQPLPEMVAFQEVIGFSAARSDSVFADLQQRLLDYPDTKKRGISPHAPYTVHPQLVEKLVTLANEQQLPVAMHLAESREELQLLRENSGPFRELLEERSMWDDEVFAGGLQPIDYLKTLSHAPRSLVVHGNYLSQSEIEFVADRNDRMSIIFCPRTHAYFGHSDYPLRAMLGAGAHVAIGTDSRASNPDLSLLSELRYLAESFPSISPEEVVVLGTLNGATALGLEQIVGSLLPGKLANLTAIKCDGTNTLPYGALLTSDHAPHKTWLHGREISTTCH